MSKLQEKYGGRGFTVIAVNGYDEPKNMVRRFIEKENLKQPVLLMGSGVARKKYGVTGFPTSFWIDQSGKVVHREVGFNPGAFAAMEGRLEKMLRSPPPK